MSHLRYLKYVMLHKWFVFLAGRKLDVPLSNLIRHDLTKFSRAEWGPYVRRFFSGRSNEADHTLDPHEFHNAFRHHWQYNKHHWEFWMNLASHEPWPMPDVYVREMVADWKGAGRAKTGSWEVLEWYGKNRDRINLHPRTRARVHQLLGVDG